MEDLEKNSSKMTRKEIDSIINNGNADDILSLLRKPTAPVQTSDLEKIYDNHSDNYNIKMKLAQHGSATSMLHDKMLDDSSTGNGVRRRLLKKGRISEEKQKQILAQGSGYHNAMDKTALSDRKDLSDDIYRQLAHHSNNAALNNVLKHKGHDFVQKILDDHQSGKTTESAKQKRQLAGNLAHLKLSRWGNDGLKNPEIVKSINSILNGKDKSLKSGLTSSWGFRASKVLSNPETKDAALNHLKSGDSRSIARMFGSGQDYDKGALHDMSNSSEILQAVLSHKSNNVKSALLSGLARDVNDTGTAANKFAMSGEHYLNMHGEMLKQAIEGLQSKNKKLAGSSLEYLIQHNATDKADQSNVNSAISNLSFRGLASIVHGMSKVSLEKLLSHPANTLSRETMHKLGEAAMKTKPLSEWDTQSNKLKNKAAQFIDPKKMDLETKKELITNAGDGNEIRLDHFGGFDPEDSGFKTSKKLYDHLSENSSPEDKEALNSWLMDHNNHSILGAHTRIHNDPQGAAQAIADGGQLTDDHFKATLPLLHNVMGDDKRTPSGFDEHTSTRQALHGLYEQAIESGDLSAKNLQNAFNNLNKSGGFLNTNRTGGLASDDGDQKRKKMRNAITDHLLNKLDDSDDSFRDLTRHTEAQDFKDIPPEQQKRLIGTIAERGSQWDKNSIVGKIHDPELLHSTLDGIDSEDPDPDMLSSILNNGHLEDDHLDRAQTLADTALNTDGRKNLHETLKNALVRHGRTDIPKTERLSYKAGVSKLRTLRQKAEEGGGVLTSQDFKHMNMNPSNMKIGHLKDGKGNISAEKLGEHIDSLPNQEYSISHDKKSTGQQHTAEPSNIFQVSLTKDHLSQLKEAGLGHVVKAIMTNQDSGHPDRGGGGVGWIRYTKGKDGHVFIDEIQSDMISRFSRLVRDRTISGEDATTFKKIALNNKHPGEVMHEAFLQHLRNSGHVGKEVHIWQGDSKRDISGWNKKDENGDLLPIPHHAQQEYDQVPTKKLGYEDAEYGDIQTQSGRHVGKPTRKLTLKKKQLQEYAYLLSKAVQLIDEEGDNVTSHFLDHFGLLDVIMEPLNKSKWDRLDEEADGKKELDMGVEELDKEEEDEKIKKLKDRWKKIKKALNADDAFMDMAAESEPDEEEQPEDGEEEQDEMQPEEGEEEGQGLDPEALQQMQEQLGDAQQGEPQAEEEEEERGPTQEDLEGSIHEEPEEEDGEMPPEEEPEEGQEMPTEEDAEMAQEQGDGEEPEGDQDEETIQMLKEQGYSDQAIAYIMHGHTPPQPTKDSHAADNELLDGEHDREHDKQSKEVDLEHSQRMNDLEYQKAQSEQVDPEAEQSHRQRMMDLEYDHAQGDGDAGKMDRDHKQKMLDLEYQKAQMLMEMEIEHKREEMKMKLRQNEDKAKHKKVMDGEKHKHQLKEQKKSMTADHNKTSQAERKGK